MVPSLRVTIARLVFLCESPTETGALALALTVDGVDGSNLDVKDLLDGLLDFHCWNGSALKVVLYLRRADRSFPSETTGAITSYTDLVETSLLSALKSF